MIKSKLHFDVIYHHLRNKWRVISPASLLANKIFLRYAAAKYALDDLSAERNHNHLLSVGDRRREVMPRYACTEAPHDSNTMQGDIAHPDVDGNTSASRRATTIVRQFTQLRLLTVSRQ